MRIRALVLLAATIMMLIGAPPQAAVAAGCSVAATPAGGAPVGSSITLSGAGWAPGEEIFVNLGGSQIGDVFADGSGSLTASAVVPNLPLGAQDLFAFNNSATCETHASFQVIEVPAPPTACTVSASPTGGAAVGSTILISGGGWAANDILFVNLGGSQLGQFSADSNGDFSASAMVPQLAVGDQMLFAFNNAASCESSVTYAVIDSTTTTTAAPATTVTAPTTTAGATTTITDAPTTITDAPTTITDAPTTTTRVGDTGSAPEPLAVGSDSSGGSLLVVILVAVAALVAGVGGAIWWTRRNN